MVVGCSRNISFANELKAQDVTNNISSTEENSNKDELKEEKVTIERVNEIEDDFDLYAEKLEGVLPSDITPNVATKVFSLIATDLLALGYELIPSYKVGGEKGIAYSNFSDAYTIDSKEKEEYLDFTGCGFISYESINNEDKCHMDPTYLSVRPEKMTFSELSSFGLLRFLDTQRVSNIKGHFVLDNSYIKYELKGDSVFVENLDKSQYDTSLGAIYDYDEHHYVFIPLKMIPDEVTTIQMLVRKIDSKKLAAAFDEMYTAQDNQGYEEKHVATLFISLEMLDLLNGTLAQKKTFNNILMDIINNMEYDPDKEYLSMNDSGEIDVLALPDDVINNSKTYKGWLLPVLMGATLTVAVCLTICTGGTGTVITGAVLGALGEFVSEALLENKSLNDINMGKILVAALTGALIAGVPVAGSAGQFTLNSIGVGLISASSSVAYSLLDGEKDANTIVKSAATQALLSIGFYGLRNIVSSTAGVKNVETVKQEAIENVNKGTSISSKFGKISDCKNQPALELTRELYAKQSVSRVVSSRVYDIATESGKDVIVDLVGDTSKHTFSQAAETFFERVF